MEVAFRTDDLRRLFEDAEFTGGFDQVVVSKYRQRIQTIESAEDERPFYSLKSLHFEKLKGDRAGQYSMRLNKKWRLILEFDGKGKAKIVNVIEIVDYH